MNFIFLNKSFKRPEENNKVSAAGQSSEMGKMTDFALYIPAFFEQIGIGTRINHPAAVKQSGTNSHVFPCRFRKKDKTVCISADFPFKPLVYLHYIFSPGPVMVVHQRVLGFCQPGQSGHPADNPGGNMCCGSSAG